MLNRPTDNASTFDAERSSAPLDGPAADDRVQHEPGENQHIRGDGVDDDAGPRRWQVPPLPSEGRWLGGVATAIAGEIGVSPMAVRYGFAALALQGGWGVVLYALAWLWLGVIHRSRVNLYQPQPKARSMRHRHIGLGLVVVGLMMAGGALGFGANNSIVIPLGLIGLGGLVAWSRRLGESGVWSTLRTVAGLLIAGAGVITAYFMFTSSTRWTELLPLILANLAILAVALPSLASVGQDLDAERSERVRADERAKVAAHLHDSVLQTLTLIQKNADDPDRTAQLARQQERELRAWLYGTAPTTNAESARMEPALQAAAEAVEQRHRIRVDVVVVGNDRDLPIGTVGDLAAAVQEALSNAAKHAGVDRVDVFAEVTEQAVEVFVRDEGCGFDPAAVGPDRRGLSESIVARMERLGGWATIHAEPGEGTEIELHLPLSPPPTGSGGTDDSVGATDD